MVKVEKRNCPHGGADSHCTQGADTPYLGRPLLLLGPRTSIPSRSEQMYTMVLGCDSDDGDRRKRLKALRRGAKCNRPAHPTLACVCLGGAIHIDVKPLLEDRTKLFVFLFSVGVLFFCQPSIRHQSMSNAFSINLLRVHVAHVLFLAYCACMSPEC